MAEASVGDVIRDSIEIAIRRVLAQHQAERVLPLLEAEQVDRFIADITRCALGEMGLT